MRYYFWPAILLVKLIASKSNTLYKLLLYFGFYSPGPRSSSCSDRFLSTFRSYYLDAKQLLPTEKLNLVCELGPGGTDFAQLAAAENNVKLFDQIDIIPLRMSFIDQEKKFSRVSNSVFSKARKAKLRNEYNYYDKGLKSLQSLPAASYEFVFSHSVLQHIYIDDVEQIVKELARIGKKDSVHIHFIDLQDCFSGGKNHLRFSDQLWHSKHIQNAGFYTNRIYADLWIELFLKNGFDLIDYQIENGTKLLLAKCAVHEDCAECSKGERMNQIRLIVRFRKQEKVEC